jgi:hypothetical protein
MANDPHFTAAQHHERAARAHLDAAELHRRGYASKAERAAIQAQLHSMKAREASSMTYITIEYTVATIDPSQGRGCAQSGASSAA